MSSKSKAKDIFVLVIGAIMLFAAFLPISTYHGYYESVSYLKGFTYLLYLIPFFVVGPAIASLYNKLPNKEIWYISVGVVGLLLTILTYMVGSNTLISFVRFFNSNAGDITPGLGLGTILLFLGYISIAIIGYTILSEKKTQKKKSEEEV